MTLGLPHWVWSFCSSCFSSWTSRRSIVFGGSQWNYCRAASARCSYPTSNSTSAASCPPKPYSLGPRTPVCWHYCSWGMVIDSWFVSRPTRSTSSYFYLLTILLASSRYSAHSFPVSCRVWYYFREAHLVQRPGAKLCLHSSIFRWFSRCQRVIWWSRGGCSPRTSARHPATWA